MHTERARNVKETRSLLSSNSIDCSKQIRRSSCSRIKILICLLPIIPKIVILWASWGLIHIRVRERSFLGSKFIDFHILSRFTVVRSSENKNGSIIILACIRVGISFWKLTHLSFENRMRNIARISVIMTSSGFGIPDGIRIRWNKIPDGKITFRCTTLPK